MIGVIIVLVVYISLFSAIQIAKFFYKKCDNFYKDLHLKYAEDFRQKIEKFKEESYEILILNKLVNQPTKFNYKLDLNKIPRYYRSYYKICNMMFVFDAYLYKNLEYDIGERDYDNYMIEVLIY